MPPKPRTTPLPPDRRRRLTLAAVGAYHEHADFLVGWTPPGTSPLYKSWSEYFDVFEQIRDELYANYRQGNDRRVFAESVRLFTVRYGIRILDRVRPCDLRAYLDDLFDGRPLDPEYLHDEDDGA